MPVVCFDWFNAVLPVNVCQWESDGVNAPTPRLFPWLIEDWMLVCWVTLVRDSDACVCLRSGLACLQVMIISA